MTYLGARYCKHLLNAVEISNYTPMHVSILRIFSTVSPKSGVTAPSRYNGGRGRIRTRGPRLRRPVHYPGYATRPSRPGRLLQESLLSNCHISVQSSDDLKHIQQKRRANDIWICQHPMPNLSSNSLRFHQRWNEEYCRETNGGEDGQTSPRTQFFALQDTCSPLLSQHPS